jgi:hypothetical protein
MEDEQQLSKKERRERKRQLKMDDAEAKARSRKAKKYSRIVAILLAVVGFGLIIWYFLPEPRALGEDRAVVALQEGQGHFETGLPIEYSNNPPTSGNHWGDPVRDGVYSDEQPDEGLVHSLEHGRIWISYKPSIPEEIRLQLEDIGDSYIRTIVTPREANDTDIALSSWGHLDKFDLSQDGSLDIERILDFRARYDDEGPEKGIPAHVGIKYDFPWYKN